MFECFVRSQTATTTTFFVYYIKKNLEDLLSVPIIQSEHDENTIRKLPDWSITEGEGIRQARAIAVLRIQRMKHFDCSTGRFPIAVSWSTEEISSNRHIQHLCRPRSLKESPLEFHHSGTEKESQAWRQGGGTRPWQNALTLGQRSYSKSICHGLQKNLIKSWDSCCTKIASLKKGAELNKLCYASRRVSK